MAKKSRKRRSEPTAPAAKPMLSRREIIARFQHPIAALIGLAWLAYMLPFSVAELPSIPLVGRDQEPWIRLQLWMASFDMGAIVDGWTGGSWENVGVAGRTWIAGWTLLQLGLAFGPGYLLLSLSGVDVALSRLERFVFGIALGLQIDSLAILAIGLAGGLAWRWLIVIPSVVCWILIVMQWLRKSRTDIPVRHEPSPQPLKAETPPTNSRWEQLLTSTTLFATLPFLTIIILGAMLPPHDFDVREYHLQAPKEWYQQGAIDFMPHNIYANMPLGAEMHALAAMTLVNTKTPDQWWYGALVGKTIMAMFVPLTALGLFTAGRRWFSATGGAIAALVYVSTPWIARTAMKGLNEPAVACYTLLAVYAIGLAYDSGRIRWQLIPLGGLMAGAAVSCKYPALLFLVVPLTLWPIGRYFVDRKREAAEPFKQYGLQSGVFVLATLLSCGLWFGKNAVLAGNPTYPLLYEVFGGTTRTAEKNEQWNAAHGGNVEFTATSFSEAAARVAWNSEWLSPLVVPLAVLGLYMAWALPGKRGPVVLCAVVIGFTLVAWYGTTHRIDRFLVPLLPLACLLAGVGASWSRGIGWRVVLGSIMVIGLTFNLLTISSPAISDVRILVEVLDLRESDPQRVNLVHAWLNDNVPRKSKVLLVGDAEPFDLEIPVIYNTVFDSNRFDEIFRDKTVDQRRAALRELGITHVYFAWGHIARYRSAGNYGYSNYVTPELVERELVEEQGLLEPVEAFPESLYRVVE